MVTTTMLVVIVENEDVMRCDSNCPGLTWLMQSYEFKVDLRVLKLGKCNVILEIDQLRIYSPIFFYFIKMKLLFNKEGRMMELRGVVKVVELKMITYAKVHKILKEAVYRFIE